MTNPYISKKILTFDQIGVSCQGTFLENTSLTQDKYLFIRSLSPEKDFKTVIIDFQNNDVIKNVMNPDIAVMNPTRCIIAGYKNYQFKSEILIINVPDFLTINKFTLLNLQFAKYMKWIDGYTLSFITDDSVFHWFPFLPNSKPFLVFKLHSQIKPNSIINYSISHDKEWCAVTSKNWKVQLYSCLSKKSKIFDSNSAAFIKDGLSTKFAYILKNDNPFENSVTLHISQLNSSSDDLSLENKSVKLPGLKPLDLSQFDYEIIIISPHFSTIFVLNQYGVLYCVEIETLFVYISKQDSFSRPVHAALTNDGNVITLTDHGEVIKFILDEDKIVDYISKGNKKAASFVANAIKSKNLIKFDQMLQIGNFSEAARFAVNSAEDPIRNQETIERIRNIPNITGEPIPPLIQYFDSILKISRLNEIESIEFCKILISQNNMSLIESLMKEDKFTYTEKLGDLFINNKKIALSIYQSVNIPFKIVVLYVELEMYNKIQTYCQWFSYKPDWIQVVTFVAYQDPDKIMSLVTYIANKGYPLTDPQKLARVLVQLNLKKQAASFLTDVLTTDKEDDSILQTCLLEIYLEISPNLAKDLFTRNCFSYYDYKRISSICIEKQSQEIWSSVILPNNKNSKHVVDAIISIICDYPDQIFQTVKFFIDAQIPSYLLNIVEKTVFEFPPFQHNTSLQNLLICTAIKSERERVMKYVTQFNDYTSDKISQLLIESNLFDEAIAVYKKFGQNIEAVRIMINNKNDIKQAADFARICDDPNIWDLVNKAQKNSNTKTPSVVDPLKIHDPQKIEQNILQYFIDIVENKKLNDGQLLDIFKSTIIENKLKLIEKWNVSNSKPQDLSDSQNSFKILDINDIQNLIKIESIGRGATSEVFKISNGQFLAMKVLSLEDDEESSESSSFAKMKRLIQEYELLSMLNHPNIIKTFGVFLGDESNPPSIIIEYCPTNLKKNVKKLTNVERVVIIYQISKAMKKVHSMNIIHRDLKPENILLDDQNQVKLSDFGLSKLMDSQTQSQTQMSFVGTMNFIAPEILLQNEKYDSKVDVFSFGVIVYFILSNGKLPAMKMLDISKGIKAEIPTNINDFSRKLISKCWNFNPFERPSFDDICNEIIKNKFQLINGIDENDPLIQVQTK